MVPGKAVMSLEDESFMLRLLKQEIGGDWILDGGSELPAQLCLPQELLWLENALRS